MNFEDDLSTFDTSYVDQVIYCGGLRSVDICADPEDSVTFDDPFNTEVGDDDTNNDHDPISDGYDANDDPKCFASFCSEEVLSIDSGLNSSDNVAGSFTTNPNLLKVNSFIIWNDPDQSFSQQVCC